MYVRSIEKLPSVKKKKYKVRLDDGTDFVLYGKELDRYNIEAGEDLSSEDYDKLLEEVFYPRAKKRAMHLLEKQDRTKANLRTKLLENGYPVLAVDVAIEYVESYGYIDDERYASNYIRYNQDNKSKRRIMTDLKSRGVDKNVIEIAMEEYTASEEEQIKRLLEKKHFDPENSDKKEIEKIYRFLVSRGFSSGEILNAVRRD